MGAHGEPVQWPTDPAGLPAAGRPETVDVAPGGTFDLAVRVVAKTLGEHTFPMLGYGGSIPGPTLRVRQGSAIRVTVRNETPASTTVHWHGLRLENTYDGVPNRTQTPVPPGGQYVHHLTFPDAGTFWYHPHVREDVAQELGLYGNVVVEPEDADYWPPADRELVLTLDDILVENGAIAAFRAEGANFAAMGRFGNVLLVGGEPHPALEVRQGEVVRFHLTNTANTRVFRVVVPGVRMKLVGGDAGRYEREEWVDSVVVAPSERAVVDVLFDEARVVEVLHETPARVHPLAKVHVRAPRTEQGAAASFDVLRVNPELRAERERIAPYLTVPPDRTLVLVARTVDKASGHRPAAGRPHHGGARHVMGAPTPGRIEWEDPMVEMNRGATAATMGWVVVDRDTGRENGAIDWVLGVGDQVKVRIVNEMASDHPMHHPFHVHGQRFLVLARDGVPEPNLVWKDTVLVETGQIVDILLDASNPGLWMAHCHIPEHLDVGMSFEFRVGEPPRTGATRAPVTGSGTQ